MLQIRGGVERDRFGKKAGKGALVTWGRAPTLGASQDATLVQMGGGMSEVAGFSASNSNTALESKPTIECGQTVRSAPRGEGAVVIEQEPRNLADIIAQMRYIVRRLTPTECERLMGLPDGWTIPSNLVITDELVKEFMAIHDNFNRIMAEYEGKPAPKPKSEAQVRKWLEKIVNPDTCPDAPRYKGCGNGWATNQPRWIFLRMFHCANC